MNNEFDSQRNWMKAILHEKYKLDMAKLVCSQDKQIKAHWNVKHNWFIEAKDDHEATKSFSQETKVKDPEKLYTSYYFEGGSQSPERNDVELESWEWPNQIQFEGMMYNKGIWTRDHMIHNIHLYYCVDKERIKCEGTLLYFSDYKNAKIKSMHNKIKDDHKVYKIQNAIENIKCRTKLGFVNELDVRELEQLIWNLTVQNKFLTSSHLMSSINSNYLGNKSL